MRLFLALLVVAGCGEEADEFSAYDPDAIGMDDAVELVPASDASTERGRGSFGALRTAVDLRARGAEVVALTPVTKGRWMWPGRPVGLASGQAACAATVAGSHMCDVQEMLTAESQGGFGGMPDAEMWMGDTRAGGTPLFTPTDTCEGYTYEGAHLAWSGISYAWRTDPSTGQQALFFETATGAKYDAECLTDLSACSATVPSGQECNRARRIACCR